MTDDLLTSEEVRAILRVGQTALAGYLVGPGRKAAAAVDGVLFVKEESA